MQIFLPFPSFERTAKCLDPKRLGKQRVEAYQLLMALKGLTNHARNHPACIMWEKHPNGLAAYTIACCDAWTMIQGANGEYYKDTVADKVAELYAPNNDDLPWWFGNDRLHKSHRQTLLFKDRSYYSKWFPSDRPFYGYWWPRG